ncbi:N-acetylneuraminate synthase family protein [Temperatibacter marinus]|uniref:N-acetylneuraminate synthase family protein n=1 Tax=Temperatibacter marinus TaxID=1456591 RepID=A0AA52HB71_9PROT|nr:N-acetylneuraminate synthase family protein [Temperatibacter marinus]WND03338.1 N-acetylneuraminate synthase family protein [Temperatibacter marinus]
MKTLLIAEIGINHNGSFDMGRRIIDSAYDCGVQAVKFQTYRPELRFNSDNPFIETFEKYHLPFDQELNLWRHAQDKGLKVMTTPFDLPSVEDCRSEHLNGVKIASFETTNLELVRGVASLQLPTYFSTGQNTLNEVKTVIATIQSYHNDIIPMHCISSYPMANKDANLAVIKKLQTELKRDIGYSDHSVGYKVSGLAVAMGATCIEKHFTIDNSLEGPDHSFSMNPDSMRELVDHITLTEEIIGDHWMGVRHCEQQIHDIARRVSI